MNINEIKDSVLAGKVQDREQDWTKFDLAMKKALKDVGVVVATLKRSSNRNFYGAMESLAITAERYRINLKNLDPR